MGRTSPADSSTELAPGTRWTGCSVEFEDHLIPLDSNSQRRVVEGGIGAQDPLRGRPGPFAEAVVQQVTDAHLGEPVLKQSVGISRASEAEIDLGEFEPILVIDQRLEAPARTGVLPSANSRQWA